LEQGKNSVFAVSLDWPGWCRRAWHIVDHAWEIEDKSEAN
jgi:hypothetical protein